MCGAILLRMEYPVKHSTAIAFDKTILKPILLVCALLIIYGVIFEAGTWKHILIGVVGIMVTAGIGQSLYPKATLSDLSSGKAWDKNGPDSVKK